MNIYILYLVLYSFKLIAPELTELNKQCSSLRFTPDPLSPFPTELLSTQCYLNSEVIEKLCELQQELFRFSASQLAPKILYLKVLECHRSPELDYERYLWTFNMSSESQTIKNIFYPNLKDKQDLRNTYIQSKSIFQDGNAVAVTLSFSPVTGTKNISKLTKSELLNVSNCFERNGKRTSFDTSLDLGSYYYCFDVQAYPDYIYDFTIYKNRQFLKHLMQKYGFVMANSINTYEFIYKQF